VPDHNGTRTQVTMTGAASLNEPAFRSVMGHYCTGIAVITGRDETGPAGLAVQSLVSVSVRPPLVLFCAQKTSTSWPRIAATGAFCANVLRADQRELCSVFATSGGDKFDGIQWSPGPSGSPILADHLAYVDCLLHATHDAGDHEIVLGRVLSVGASQVHKPLLYYRGDFGLLAG
jgi:3-hydroxy-9,10-secoandrosta-1,3,5(10)-triene-9,17-dione monooxygenase reductase component